MPTIDVQVMPWLVATQTLNGSGNPQRGKYGSAYMIGNFTDTECETIYRNLRQLDVPERPGAASGRLLRGPGQCGGS